MRTAVLTMMALLLLGALANHALAEQFAFDPNSGIGSARQGSVVPVVIVAIVSLLGAIVIVSERRKAKGIWFSNSERLR